MKYLLLALTFGTSMLFGMAPREAEPQSLVVNNRILTQVNGKTISVIDVMKKMDVYLNRYYPQYIDSKVARFQFYTQQWRDTLNQMVDTELMLADAENKEISITDGEIRETIQERFGPNVMATLDKLGITYEEARKMIYSEMVVQRMTWFKVHSKAVQSVNPQDIKLAYKEYCEKNPPSEEWKYQVLTLRSDEGNLDTQIAEKAYEFLAKQGMALASVVEKLRLDHTAIATNLSPEYTVQGKDLSQSHKEILLSLKKGNYSHPISQVSRFDNSIVYRIFYLIDYAKKELPAFPTMADPLQDQLIEKAIAKESAIYLAKLRERYGYENSQMQNDLPLDFQPFTLN